MACHDHTDVAFTKQKNPGNLQLSEGYKGMLRVLAKKF